MTTETRVKYNQYSQKLRDEVMAHAPKPGQVIYFESAKKTEVKRNGVKLVQYPTKVGIPPKDTILDPFTKEWVEIACIRSERDGTFEELAAYGAEGGRIACRGSVPNDLKIFEYLFLCNFNQTAKGSIKKTRPNCGFLIEQVEPAKTAREKLEFKRKVRDAQEAVDGFGDSVLRSFAVGLNLHGITEFSDNDEIRIQLLDKAEKNPDEILLFDRDFEKKFEIKVKRMEEKGIIEFASQKWMWGDTQDVIFTVKVGEKKIDALKKFLSEHPEVKEMMDKKLELVSS